MWTPFLAMVAPAVACTEASDLHEIADDAAAAHQAVADVDAERLRATTDALEAQLPCLREPMNATVAASVHRARALRAFADRAPSRATQAFAAARILEPWYTPGEALIPPGHPLQSLFEGAVSAGTFVPLTPPRAGRLIVDGGPTEGRPADRAHVFQWIDPDGVVQLTSYLWPDDPLPPYPVAHEQHGNPWPWRVAAGFAASSVAVYVGAAWTRLQYDGAVLSERERLARTTNALVVTSATLAAGSFAAVVVGASHGSPNAESSSER